jgi:hypothetical protein
MSGALTFLRHCCCHRCCCCCHVTAAAALLLLLLPRQLVEELLTFWSLEDYEDTLEELEEALIVSSHQSSQQNHCEVLM